MSESPTVPSALTRAIDKRFSSTKTRRLLRDGAVFLILSGFTIALFAITLFLFRSLADRRADLARRWTDRGELALQQGHGEYAVQALRTALGYDANNRLAQISLAQALAGSGRTEEATNYFLNLWEARPGDGFVNLELARLLRRKGDAAQSINYYRSAIFGSWNGDGTTKRREVRLELADFFTSRGDDAAARAELLIAAGNAPQSEAIDVTLGDRLEAIGDSKDALQLYEKAVQIDPRRRSALEKAGRTAYELGDYSTAVLLLSRAMEQAPAGDAAADADEAALRVLVSDARRVQQLSLSRSLPAEERARHLATAAGIASQRLQSCLVHAASPSSGQNAGSSKLVELDRRWSTMLRAKSPKQWARDAALADQAQALVGETETMTARWCGPLSGDDALLLMLAVAPGGSR